MIREGGNVVLEGVANLYETPDAIKIHDGTREVWLPKSVLTEYPDEGRTGEVHLPEWLAVDKGLV